MYVIQTFTRCIISNTVAFWAWNNNPVTVALTETFNDIQLMCDIKIYNINCMKYKHLNLFHLHVSLVWLFILFTF
jgi:hypothetical protein